MTGAIGPIVIGLLVLTGWLLYKYPDKAIETAGKFTSVPARKLVRYLLAVVAVVLLTFFGWRFGSDLLSKTKEGLSSFALQHVGWAILLIAIVAIVGIVLAEKIKTPRIRNVLQVPLGGGALLLILYLLVSSALTAWGHHEQSVRQQQQQEAASRVVQRYPQTPVPDATKGEWIQVLIQPGKSTGPIPIPVHKELVMKPGSAWLKVRTLYQDGRSPCLWNGTPCPGGKGAEAEIVNNGVLRAWASYAFAPAGTPATRFNH